MRITIQHVCGLLVLVSGCSTHQPAISSSSGAIGRTNGISSQFHVAALAGDSTAAFYSFQKAKGQLGSAKESLSESAAMAVTGPASSLMASGVILDGTIRSARDEGGLLWGAAIAGAAGGAEAVRITFVAPAIAVNGLIRSMKTVSPRELAERAADLEGALKEAAAQDRFQQFLLTSAEEECPGRMLAMDPDRDDEPTNPFVDALLEARIDQLRLERARSDEGSYFLRITAHARLVRKGESDALYEQSVEYRSGRALFLDWTDQGAVQGVAETGYRALAEYFVSQIR